VDASTDAIGISSAKGKHFYQNASFDDLLGDIGSDPPSTIYTNEKVGREIFSTIMNGAPWVGEVEMNGKDGNPLIIFLRAYPVKDSDGNVRRLVGVHTNITKQKRTEEELTNFKQAVDASTDAIGMSTAHGDHYYQNAAFDDLFGNIGNDPPSTIYADEKIGREVFEAIMGGIPWIGEVNMYDKNGKILNIFLRAYPIKDDDGNIRRLVGVHTNITKQKQTEEELRKHREHLQELVTERTRELQESEARFRQISDNINDVFYLYSNDYKTVYYVSPGFEKIWGKNIQDLYDNPWIFTESIYEDDRQRVEAFKKRILASLNFNDAAIEYRILNADGNIRWIQDEMFPVYDLTGKISRIAGSARDITRRKNIESALRSSREKSRDLSRYLQRAVEDERIRIAREIHDDLGQTLIAMKMNLVSCRNKLPDHLDPLFETALNMELTIDQMIQSIKIMISDLRAGPLSDLGLEAAIEWLANNFFKDSGYDTRIELNTKSVEIDPNRGMALFRVAQESLTNIVRHSNATVVTVSLFTKNKQAILRISDNGSGIADTSALPNDSYGIMGMKERVGFFKGNLTIESNEKSGTTITATISMND